MSSTSLKGPWPAKLLLLTILLLPWLAGTPTREPTHNSPSPTPPGQESQAVSDPGSFQGNNLSAALKGSPLARPYASWRVGSYAAASRTATGASRCRKPEHLAALVRKYAALYGIEEKLVWAVMRQESGFNTWAVSPKGAMGLMQLMPETAALMGVTDPFNIEQNIAGGLKFLRRCLDRFHDDVVLALAAYNAGPENVDKYNGCPPFAETQNYVASIMLAYAGQPWEGAGRWKARRSSAGGNQGTAPPPKKGLDWKIPPPQFRVGSPRWKISEPKIKLGAPIPKATGLAAGKRPPLVGKNPGLPAKSSPSDPPPPKNRVQSSKLKYHSADTGSMTNSMM